MTSMGTIDGILDLLFPRTCLVCQHTLIGHEQHLCTHCFHNIPITQHHLHKNNSFEQLFFGKIDIERAMAYYFFSKESDYSHLIHLIKYKGEKEAASYLGEQYGYELLKAGTLEHIDAIVPVPLSWGREKRRGYNQSEWIAMGISKALNIPLYPHALVRIVENESQTHKSIYERWRNTHQIFDIGDPLTSGNLHILLVDDVVTTGATLLSCAKVLKAHYSCIISIATLAVAI